MPDTTEKTLSHAIQAVMKLLGNEKLQNNLKDEEHFQESMEAMGMPVSFRGKLLSLLTRVEQLQVRAADKTVRVNTDRFPQPTAVAQNDRYEKIQLEAFEHIRMSFWIALGMNIVLFLIGLVLMGIAVFQAVLETYISTSTLTVAGLALANFVLLSFRRPWKDISQLVRANTDSSTQAVALMQDDKYEKMQLEAFEHIRTSFWVALGMSVALFLIGLVLMGIAVFQAVRETSVSTATLTVAGLGLADFVLLFFRRPWQDISVNLSNSQQVRTIATSYLVGLALLQRNDPNSLKLLNELTEHSVVMLQQYTEERPSDHEDTPKAPEESQ